LKIHIISQHQMRIEIVVIQLTIGALLTVLYWFKNEIK